MGQNVRMGFDREKPQKKRENWAEEREVIAKRGKKCYG